eukprot:1177537-Prorocentrum_minimum.AAC.1
MLGSVIGGLVGPGNSLGGVGVGPCWGVGVSWRKGGMRLPCGVNVRWVAGDGQAPCAGGWKGVEGVGPIPGGGELLGELGLYGLVWRTDLHSRCLSEEGGVGGDLDLRRLKGGETGDSDTRYPRARACSRRWRSSSRSRWVLSSLR